MRYASLCFTTICLLFFLCCKNQTLTQDKPLIINHTNPNITYSGRIDSVSSKCAKVYWSGSSISMNFEGSSISASLEDNTGDSYYNVILDEDSMYILRPDTLKQYHLLAKNLKRGKHNIQLFKRTEPHYGNTNFYDFKIEGKAKLLPKSVFKKRKIEFYGNSITAGYAVEDVSGADSPDSTYTNNYLSYSAITARHFDAEYRAICKSGIGIMVSWHGMIMPEMYNRLNPHDPESTWDFSLYQPDIVVINLFQNDSWLVKRPDNENFKTRFGNTAPSENEIITAYQAFVQKIRSHYLNSHIICILGNMDVTKEGSKWPEYINIAVNNLNDDKIYTHFIPYKKSKGHPSVKEQELIAEDLIRFIEQHINW